MLKGASSNILSKLVRIIQIVVFTTRLKASLLFTLPNVNLLLATQWNF